MEKVKTQLVGSERRIITKVVNGQRRVSCSCCEEAECCMYPADQLGVGYTIDDLPETLTANIPTNTGVLNFAYTKLSPPQMSSAGLAYYLEDNSAALNSGDENVLYLVEGDDRWELWTGGDGVASNGCLVNDRVQDTFADTYLLTALGESVGVARQSLCLWTGTDSCGFVWQLSYGFQGLIQAGPAREYAWNIIASENQEDCSAPDYSLGTKSGFQNTPVGSYGGNVDATVSE